MKTDIYVSIKRQTQELIEIVKLKNVDDQTAEKLIRNTYNVLLTRGMRGTYVYCEDEKLRDYLKSLIS